MSIELFRVSFLLILDTFNTFINGLYWRLIVFLIRICLFDLNKSIDNTQ